MTRETRDLPGHDETSAQSATTEALPDERSTGGLFDRFASSLGGPMLQRKIQRRALQRRAGAIQRRPAVQRNELNEAIRARRGEVMGMDQEDLKKERGTEDFVSSGGKRSTEEAQQVKPSITPEGFQHLDQNVGSKMVKFISGHGKRSTEEAQGMGVDPMVDRMKIESNLRTRNKLGEQGFDTLLREHKDHERDKQQQMHEPQGSLLEETRDNKDTHQQGVTEAFQRQAEEKRRKEEAKTEATQQGAALKLSLAPAKHERDRALQKATWDTAALNQHYAAAEKAVNAITEPMPEALNVVQQLVGVAQNAIDAINVRARQDIEWMEMLQPYDEAKINQGIQLYNDGNKTIINNNMMGDWEFVLREGVKDTRNVPTIRARIVNLAKEADRKTPFDAEETKKKMSGPPNKRSSVMSDMQNRVSVNRTISEIVKVEPNAEVLDGLVRKFDSLEGLDYLLGKTPDRKDLSDLAQRAGGELPPLKRVYVALGDDPARVKFLVLGNGGQKIRELDDWLQRGGEVWEGGTTGAPALRPNGTTKEHIESVAVPKDGNAGPAPGGYAGNRVYGSNTRPPDMLLPQYTGGSGITYREFDTKPWQPGQNRGAERFVKGSDGRYYHTNDHYVTFKKFA